MRSCMSSNGISASRRCVKCSRSPGHRPAALAVLAVLVEAGAAAAPGAAELVDHAVDDRLGGVRRQVPPASSTARFDSSRILRGRVSVSSSIRESTLAG